MPEIRIMILDDDIELDAEGQPIRGGTWSSESRKVITNRQAWTTAPERAILHTLVAEMTDEVIRGFNRQRQRHANWIRSRDASSQVLHNSGGEQRVGGAVETE